MKNVCLATKTVQSLIAYLAIYSCEVIGHLKYYFGYSIVRMFPINIMLTIYAVTGYFIEWDN